LIADGFADQVGTRNSEIRGRVPVAIHDGTESKRAEIRSTTQAAHHPTLHPQIPPPVHASKDDRGSGCVRLRDGGGDGDNDDGTTSPSQCCLGNWRSDNDRSNVVVNTAAAATAGAQVCEQAP